ncbi:FUSC family membrane protein [Noviherbaspirillum galbum]|uniref:FUSC family protein n=1 Tax=Noviherbaspirillum galbum TaxID=2709383 RepID=A0A6B3STC1_9BURK|nr:FUSC family membrane protein [Noviherbaspirillum galbum]NEX64017.1 FUSC family protein [Noviherbaspirillum galbum]
MHYALSPRTFFFSHYFYTGLRIATGVVGIALLATLAFGERIGVAVAFGALCNSLMDLPSPLKHKFNEMLTSVLLCSAIALVSSLCAPHPWLLVPLAGLVGFITSMLVVFGRKAMPLQFAALFTMMQTGSNPTGGEHAVATSLLFFAGGFSYMLYSLAVSWWLRERIKQQVLAESLYALAAYLRIKAGFYDARRDLGTQFTRLVRQQTTLAERQQASRDLILRVAPAQRDTLLVRAHYAMLDVYELALAMHPDYALLRKHVSDGDLLMAFGRLAGLLADDLENVAFAMAQNRLPAPPPDRGPELDRIEAQARQATDAGRSTPAADYALRVTIVKLRELLRAVERLHRPGSGASIPEPPAIQDAWAPFLSRQRYEWRILVSEIRLGSPTFRYAIRVAVGISFALALSRVLPYATHGYWIALTVAVILKPNYSMTRRRRNDRVIGTLVGSVLTALILKVVHAPLALLGMLFIATAAAPAFLNIRYLYTAIAASAQVLLLIGLTTPEASHAMLERLLDTGVGVLIAGVFTYVLPSWEYEDIPRQADRVLAANRGYIAAWRKLLLDEDADDFAYRVARKRFMDSIAGLGNALQRMQDEPENKRYALMELDRFVVQNYLVVAHCAAIRLIMHRHPAPPENGLPAAMIERIARGLAGQLGTAQEALRAPEARLRAADASAAREDGTEETSDAARAWTGYRLLQQRARQLASDADVITGVSAAIGSVFRQAGVAVGAARDSRPG